MPPATEPSPIATTSPPGLARRQVRLAAKTAWALLLGGLVMLAAVVLVRQGLVPLVDALFDPGEAWLSACRRIGIVLATVAGYRGYVRWHEGRIAVELRVRPLRVLLGGAAGMLLVGVPIILLFAIGAYEVVQFRGGSSALWGVAALIGIAATLEELAYRALLFRLLERAWGTIAALVLQALVFGVGHLQNLPAGSAADIAAMLVSVGLLGLLWAGLFVLTRNVWVVAAHHAAWNFTILLSGVPLSGIGDWRGLAPFESVVAGPDWLTGGAFGPESSLLVIATTSVATAWLLRLARRRGAFVAASAP
jgi:membrane protease YdiL (CAAX protease family)